MTEKLKQDAVVLENSKHFQELYFDSDNEIEYDYEPPRVEMEKKKRNQGSKKKSKKQWKASWLKELVEVPIPVPVLQSELAVIPQKMPIKFKRSLKRKTGKLVYD